MLGKRARPVREGGTEALSYQVPVSYLMQALVIREQVLGSEHPETATTISNLATLYQAQDRYEEAKSLYQRALAIRERVLGPEHTDSAQSLNNLPVDYDGLGPFLVDWVRGGSRIVEREFG